MSLPTASDINPHDDLDGRCAQDHFLGKSVRDAVELFATNGGAVEDLMWMGPRAFVFYVPSALLYLESDVAAGGDDWGVVDALPETIAFRLDHEATTICEAWPTIERLCTYVLAHSGRLCRASEDRAGLEAKYRALRDRIGRLRAERDRSTR